MEADYLEKQNSSLLIKKKVAMFASKWKWFLLSILVTTALTYMYLKYATEIYSTSAKVLIKDPSNSKSSEFAAFSDISPIPFSSNAISDELDIFNSKKLLSVVVKKLNLNVEQYRVGNIKTSDIYGDTPYIISFSSNLERVKPVKIFINELEGNTYQLLSDNKILKKGRFDTLLNFNGGKLKVSKNPNYVKEHSEDIMLKISSIHTYASYLQEQISVNLKDKGSSIIILSTRMSNRKKAEDILNSLIIAYNAQAIDEENLVSKNTSDFIAERLQLIKEELDVVELNKVSFKKGNGLTDIKSEVELFINQTGESQSMIFDVEIQLELIDSMISYLNDNSRESNLLPINIGIKNPDLNNLMLNYNKLIFEKNSLLKFSTELNPFVENLNNEIADQREILLESLINQKNNQLILKKDIKKRSNKIRGKIAAIPQQEKEYRIIERQQNLKEALYLFLLQRREETSLLMARTSPKAKIIEDADTETKPLAPKPKVLFLGSLLIGILLPALVIQAKNFLDTKIKDRLELELLLKNIPILGELPNYKNGRSGVITKNDRSILGESFRVLRTNLNYFLKIKKKENQALKIFITSTIKGEGKTFITYNTALSLAEASKKVLVIGADIRNPQIHRYLDINKNTSGLSEYLYDNEIKVEDIVRKVNLNDSNLDFILSGKIPPNPSELLINGRFERLLSELATSYDYLIIDTAPTMLVADTLSICESADVMMYVVRAGFTDKNLLGYISKLEKDGKVNNVALVLNDVEESNIGYGYSYGYGNVKRKSLMDRFTRR